MEFMEQAVAAIRQSALIGARAALSARPAMTFGSGFTDLPSKTIDDIARDADEPAELQKYIERRRPHHAGAGVLSCAGGAGPGIGVENRRI
jgi:hypothetical protein